MAILIYYYFTLVNNVGYSVEYPDYFLETPEEVSCEEQWLYSFCCFWRMSTLVSIATLQDCSGQLSPCCTGEVFAAWWEPSLPFFSISHFILLLFFVFFPPPFRWPTCYCQRWLKCEHFSFTQLAYLSPPPGMHTSTWLTTTRGHWTSICYIFPHTCTPRGRGVIVNISSAVADHPLQLLRTYSATKLL